VFVGFGPTRPLLEVSPPRFMPGLTGEIVQEESLLSSCAGPDKTQPEGCA
jgi:hypothetical protein